MKKNFLVSEEIALNEVRTLVELNDSLPTERTDDEIKQQYKHIIYAVCTGNLILGKDKPEFTLFNPISDDEGNVAYDVLKIKTRIPTSDMEKITKGINMKTELLKMNNQLLSYIGGVPKAILDKMSKTDTSVLTELMAIFL